MTEAVLVDGLVKSFGRTRALNGLTLAIKAGEVHGLLGPNGSGKTTTIRVLLGILRADAGHARVLGADPWRDAVRLHRRVAYVPGDVTLWPNLTGGEAIDLFASLRGGLDRARRTELEERFQLDPKKRCRAYSKGNRQKVALVAAFASTAELFILDEPTTGLDPLMEAAFQQTVREVSARGATVLLSSHIFSEVEALCSTVSIVRDGVTVESGTLAQLRHLTRTSVAVEATQQIPGLADLPGVHDLVTDGSRARFDVDSSEMSGVLRHLAEFDVQTLVSQPPTLEELFLRHYSDGTSTGAAAPAGGPR